MLGDMAASLVADDWAPELEDWPIEPEPDDAGLDPAGAGAGLGDSLVDCVLLVVFEEVLVLLLVCVVLVDAVWLLEAPVVCVEFCAELVAV